MLDSESMRKVLVVGDVMTDIIVRPEGRLAPGSDRRAAIRMLPGGSGANQAAWLATCGVDVTFLGRVGAEDRTQQIFLLEAHGVRPVLAADRDRPTGTLVTLLAPEGERSFLTDRGANAALARGDLPDALLDGIDLLHVSGYALFEPGPRAAVLDFIAEARRRNIRFSIDPASWSFLEEAGPENFLRWTRGASICFPNDDEARTLSGTPDLAAQLERLSAIYPLVIIKRGALGAAAAEASGVRWSVDAASAAAIDTSGAGDAFLGGFLSFWLEGRDTETSLRRAVELGTRAVTILGGRPPLSCAISELDASLPGKAP